MKRYERIHHKVRVDYSLFPDGKWRLKFIQYETQFKNKQKEDHIYLRNTFSILEHKPMFKKINVEERFLYSNVLFDHIVKNDSENFRELELDNKSKIFLIVNKIKLDAGMGVLPYKSRPYSFSSYISQDQPISNKAVENIVEVFYFNYSYPLNNFIRIFYLTTTSIKANLYNQNSIGIWTDH